MYEYKIETSQVKNAEELMNSYASNNWRVVSVLSNLFKGFGLIIVFEKENKK